MDGDFAIERNRGQLLAVVVGLFAEIGLTEGGTVERLSRPVYRKALRVLRSAESAVRRLIVFMARDIVVEPREPRPSKPRQKPSTKPTADAETKPRRKRGFFFKLFDPLKRFEKGYVRPPKRKRPEPRVRYIDIDPREAFLRRFYGPPPAPPEPVVEEKVDDSTVNAIHLCRRLFALLHALEDLQSQAMRLARWQAQPIEERRPQRSSPLRVGRPPGFRQRPTHEVHEILKECHWLARQVHVLDTS